MSISKLDCPVPFDQQPLNEYLALKRSWLFAWSISKTKTYVVGVILIFTCILTFIGFFVSAFITIRNFVKVFLLDFTISDTLLLFIFMRLYLGWSYIMKRLLSATIFYEESGWYDGQIWIKTSKYLMQDRLVGFYEIMPFILRIKYTCIIIIVTFLFSFILYILY
uniref:Ycf36 n=1 Tax=Osmundaria fimbriata TaxID=228265 RepID=A0A1Z1M4L2_OSMFI|nr:hypothetical protein [Osmundaria fimbriata]ARW60850.1 hypothetical protein [Osmundaria fimbriata]